MKTLVLVDPGSPTGQIALEAALTLRQDGGEVVVAGCGERDLRRALAVGADRAVLLSDGERLARARSLASLVESEGADLVVVGGRVGRTAMNLIGPAVAQLTGRPHVGAVSSVTAGLLVERRKDGMLESLRCPLPAVMSIEWGRMLRYPLLPGRLRAAKAVIEEWSGPLAESEGLSRSTVLAATGPKPRRKLPGRTAPGRTRRFS